MLTLSGGLALFVFLVAYVFIVSEKINKTIVVLLGSLIVFVLKIYLDPHHSNQLLHALEYIDFNVIALIIGMMIIVNLTSQSGLFTAIAMKIIVWSKGNIKVIFFLLMVLTALLTAFLSNVTTVMIMTPIFLAISLRFKINPLPFLMSEILLSNIGGAMTPLGDMTNIIIASKAGFSFMKVATYMGPPLLIIILIIAYLTTILNKKKLVSSEGNNIEDILEEKFIRDKTLMIQGVSVLIVVVACLIFKEYLHLENGIISLGGAMVLLLITKTDPDYAFNKYVNWSIIFFFIGLFVMIGGLEVTGIIEIVANKIALIGEHNMPLLGMVLLFSSAIFSAFVDNIPFATAMIPVIKNIGIIFSTNVDAFYWCLAFGACIGGSGTLVGASCNLVVVGIAEHNGYKISFLEYLKYAFPLMMLAVSLSGIYLWIFIL